MICRVVLPCPNDKIRSINVLVEGYFDDLVLVVSFQILFILTNCCISSKRQLICPFYAPVQIFKDTISWVFSIGIRSNQAGKLLEQRSVVKCRVGCELVNRIVTGTCLAMAEPDIGRGRGAGVEKTWEAPDYLIDSILIFVLKLYFLEIQCVQSCPTFNFLEHKMTSTQRIIYTLHFSFGVEC